MYENIIKENPEKIFRKHGGILRMKDALAHGITRYMLYALCDKGIIEQVSRGIYRLSALPPLSNPDLAIIGLKWTESQDRFFIFFFRFYELKNIKICFLIKS